MARDRLKFTRPDQTGFGKSVKTRRPALSTIELDAIESFKAAPGDLPEATEPTKETPPPAPSSAKDAEPQQEHELTTDVPKATERRRQGVESGLDMATESSSPAIRSARKDKHDLAELVLPPRSANDRNAIYVTLRLRVLARHVAGLRELEARGVPREAVLRSAFRTMPKIRIEPRYVPQVQEASGANEWAHRYSQAVLPDTLEAIAAQVRGGDRAPKSALILGQIEPLWFANLDDTIEKLMK